MATPKSLDKNQAPKLTPEEKKIANLEKQIRELTKLVASTQNAPVVSSNIASDSEIPYNKQIRIMSLCPEILNLSTEKAGRGHRYTFEGFGEVKKIPYGDLIQINQNHRNFLEGGKYYILDERVILEEGLTYVYEKILPKEKIEEVLSNGEKALEYFQQADRRQQKLLVDMVVRAMSDGKVFDFNLIANMDRVYNDKNDPNYISINDRVKNNKELMSSFDKDREQSQK